MAVTNQSLLGGSYARSAHDRFKEIRGWHAVDGDVGKRADVRSVPLTVPGGKWHTVMRSPSRGQLLHLALPQAAPGGVGAAPSAVNEQRLLARIEHFAQA